MCDPVSALALAGTAGTALGGASTLVPLAAGVGTSLIGGEMSAQAAKTQQEQQLNQNLAAEMARNGVLNQFLAKQNQYQAQNNASLKPAVAAVAPAAVTQNQAQDATSRINAANSTINAGTAPSPVAPLPNSPAILQDTMNARSAAGIDKAKADAGAGAQLGSYGDENTNIGLSNQTAGRAIDTTNSFARGDANMLQNQQQLAGFQAQVGNPVYPASTMGSAVSGLGNVFATLAGSGKLKLPAPTTIS
jgi:hypothetical protein